MKGIARFDQVFDQAFHVARHAFRLHQRHLGTFKVDLGGLSVRFSYLLNVYRTVHITGQTAHLN